MKRISLVLALVASAGLSACASLDGASRADDTDWQKVSLVEQYHRSRGSIVVWINYPQKRNAAEQTASATN